MQGVKYIWIIAFATGLYCLLVSSPEALAQEYKRYHHEVGGWSIELPRYFDIEKSSMSASFGSKTNSETVDVLVTDVSEIDRIRQDASPHEYAQYTLDRSEGWAQEMSDLVDGYSLNVLDARETALVSGRRAAMIAMTNKGEAALCIASLTTKRGNKIYTVDYYGRGEVCRSSDTMKQAFMSFQLH